VLIPNARRVIQEVWLIFVLGRKHYDNTVKTDWLKQPINWLSQIQNESEINQIQNKSEISNSYPFDKFITKG
jgi:hypothetical protein